MSRCAARPRASAVPDREALLLFRRGLNFTPLRSTRWIKVVMPILDFDTVPVFFFKSFAIFLSRAAPSPVWRTVGAIAT